MSITELPNWFLHSSIQKHWVSENEVPAPTGCQVLGGAGKSQRGTPGLWNAQSDEPGLNCLNVKCGPPAGTRMILWVQWGHRRVCATSGLLEEDVKASWGWTQLCWARKVRKRAQTWRTALSTEGTASVKAQKDASSWFSLGRGASSLVPWVSSEDRG